MAPRHWPRTCEHLHERLYDRRALVRDGGPLGRLALGVLDLEQHLLQGLPLVRIRPREHCAAARGPQVSCPGGCYAMSEWDGKTGNPRRATGKPRQRYSGGACTACAQGLMAVGLLAPHRDLR